MNYCTKETDEALTALGSTRQGLTAQEAEARLARDGKNKLVEGKKTTLLQRFLGQLADPMIIVLLIAAALGIVMGAGVAAAGGRVQRVGGTIIDTWLGFPSILLSVLVVTVLERGAGAAMVAIGLSFAPFFARLTLTSASAVAGRDFVAAGRLLGLSRIRIVRRYPNSPEYPALSWLVRSLAAQGKSENVDADLAVGDGDRAQERDGPAGGAGASEAAVVGVGGEGAVHGWGPLSGGLVVVGRWWVAGEGRPGRHLGRAARPAGQGLWRCPLRP